MVSMSKMPNALLNNASRLATQDDGIVGNMAAGTQYGFSPHLAQLDASTPLTLRPMTMVVTHVPGQFKYLPNFPEFCKIFFEQLCHSVSGLTVEYTNEGHPAPAHADGQTPTMTGDTKRSAVNPTFSTAEYIGMPCYNFIKTWLITNKDPDTQAASMAGILDPSVYIPPHTYSVFSADIMGIQYDTTLRSKNIVDAIQLTAVHPQGTGDAGFQHIIGESQLPTREFQFHAVLQHNPNVGVAAREIADTLGLHKVNAQFSPAIAREIDSLILNMGIQKETATDVGNYVPMGANQAILSS